MADIKGSQIQGAGSGGGDDDDIDIAAGGQLQEHAQHADDILDEIDGLLESNAEDFVKSYVQKGGE